MPVTRNQFLLPLALLVGGFVRFFHLGRKSLWLDEAISFEIARLNWHNLLTVISGREVNMSLYYGALHLWIRMGQGEFMLRALSALFGTLAILFIYLLASDWLGPSAGVCAAWLTALNPALVAFSQEARAYSLVVLLGIASFFLFKKALASKTWTLWALFAVVTACGFYAHVFFVWLIIVQWLYLLCTKREAIARNKIVTAYGICAILIMPLIRVVGVSANTQLSWIPAPAPSDLLRVSVDSAGSGGGLLAGLYALFAIAGLLALYREKDSIEILLVFWWLLPVLLTLLVSFWIPSFIPRYLLLSVPPMLVLAAAGISSARSVMLQRIALGIVLAVSAYGTHLYLRSTVDSKQSNDWRGAAAYMSQVLGDGDGVLFYYGAERFPFDYYFRQHPSHARIDVYPNISSVDLLLGAPRLDNLFLQAFAGRHPRVFVLSEFQPNETRSRVINALSSGCSLGEKSAYFGFVRVEQLDCAETVTP